MGEHPTALRCESTPTVQDALRLSLNWHSGGPEGPAQIQAVINVDDPHGRQLADTVSIPVIEVSRSELVSNCLPMPSPNWERSGRWSCMESLGWTKSRRSDRPT